MKRIKKQYLFFALCLLGAIVRLIYGYYYTPWDHAPDQIAWEILLEDGSFIYDQLIYYPHEGGSILVSILSQVIKLFTEFNSLVISAFLLDCVSRFIQISVVDKVFDKRTALIFGVWTIFASPTIIPWGTANFGLHSISSFFPFILIYILSLKEKTKKYQILSGLFLGFAFWFSYSNIVLIPVFFLYQILSREKFKIWIYSFASLSAVLFFHLLVRYYSDSGFHLAQFAGTSIRGTSFMLTDIETWKRTYTVFSSLANSAIVNSGPINLTEIMKYGYFSLLILGAIGLLKSYAKKLLNKSVYLGSVVILLFLVIYAISPFFNDSDTGNYVSYRHLTYILPFASLYIIVGLSALKGKAFLLTPFLLIGVYCTSQLFTEKPTPKNPIMITAAGWALGAKLGHDPVRLSRIVSTTDNNSRELLVGIGWGVGTALFEYSDVNDSTITNQQIDKLLSIVNGFPKKSQSYVLEGIEFSFSHEVTPRLDSTLLLMFQEAFKQQSALKIEHA